MNERIKELWVEELRSGDYKQGHLQLRTDDNRFCCLGVLCNIHAREHPEVANAEIDPTQYMAGYELTDSVVDEWAGLPEDHELIMPFSVRATKDQNGYGRKTFRKGDCVSFAGLNDSGCNFRQIADIIEAAL